MARAVYKNWIISWTFKGAPVCREFAAVLRPICPDVQLICIGVHSCLNASRGGFGALKAAGSGVSARLARLRCTFELKLPVSSKKGIQQATKSQLLLVYGPPKLKREAVWGSPRGVAQAHALRHLPVLGPPLRHDVVHLPKRSGWHTS